MFRTPTEVLMITGQIEVMKITKIAEGWLSRKPASDSGSQASGGMVRSTWKIGSSPRIAQVLWPIRTPSAMPTMAANAKPTATRLTLLAMCQNAPLSMPPLSKNGSAMKSHVSTGEPRHAERIDERRRIEEREGVWIAWTYDAAVCLYGRGTSYATREEALAALNTERADKAANAR